MKSLSVIPACILSMSWLCKPLLLVSISLSPKDWRFYKCWIWTALYFLSAVSSENFISKGSESSTFTETGGPSCCFFESISSPKTFAMKKINTRMIIYAKDIERITGRKPRTCYAILQKIKLFYNKQKSDYVTVREFCHFLNIDEELVREYLED